jgi:hypothetical protein
MPLSTDTYNIIKAASNADFDNEYYYALYSIVDTTVTVNGLSLPLVAGVIINTDITSISATANVFIIGDKKTSVDAPTTLSNYPEPEPEPDGIITENLVLNVDAVNTDSYPGSGTLLTDLTGNYNATLVNGVGFTSDDGGALVFDGVDDYGTFGNVLNFGTSDAWTVSIWFNNAQTLASTSNIYGLISKRDVNNVNGWTISLRGGAAKGLIIRFTTTGLTSDLAPVADYTSTFSDGNWHNLTVTYGTDDIGKLYVDGVFEVQKSFPNYDFTNTRRLLLSSFEDNTNFPTNQLPLNGKISQAAVYDTDLSAEDVLYNYNVIKARY